MLLCSHGMLTCRLPWCAEPQAKGPYLGLTIYDRSKLPPTGLLWESDAPKGGKHDVYRARVDEVGCSGLGHRSACQLISLSLDAGPASYWPLLQWRVGANASRAAP